MSTQQDQPLPDVNHLLEQQLLALPEGSFFELLQAVFGQRFHSPESSYQKKYFLGIAWRYQEENQPWSPWETCAVAPPAPAGTRVSPDAVIDGKSGHCSHCGTSLVSISRKALCSICGNETRLTE